jgi:hypothetical protein
VSGRLDFDGILYLDDVVERVLMMRVVVLRSSWWNLDEGGRFEDVEDAVWLSEVACVRPQPCKGYCAEPQLIAGASSLSNVYSALKSKGIGTRLISLIDLS